jgi:hypothetical protein
MGIVVKILDRLRSVKKGRKLGGILYLGVDPFAPRKGKSPIADVIEKFGLREGEVVAIEKGGSIRIIGRKPELIVDNK